MAVLVFSVLFIHLILTTGVKSFLLDDSLQVQTKNGEITGFQSDVNFDGRTYQVKKFLGIPYAEPPVGHLRFRKSVPLKSRLPTPFIANAFGPVCPQQVLFPGFTYSEDCLFLNVYAPSQAQGGASPKPVMIWIHGGGFFLGFSDPYDASVLSTFADVIVVTVNYRLGPLGFFSTHDQNALGNYGLWDQHLAIKWVQDNIGAFGGDSANMTIFGESAGSSSVVYQMMYPGNKGLFKRAIAESGTIAIWAVTDKQTNYNSSLDFAAYVGCNGAIHSNILSCLRQKSVGEIEEAVKKYMNTYKLEDIHPAWVPVYDGDFVIAEPADMLAEVSNTNTSSKYEHFYDTDLLIGANNWDGSVYIPFWMLLLNKTANASTNAYATSKPEDYHVSDYEFHHVLIPRAAEAFLRQIPFTQVNEAIRFEYTNWDDPANNTARVVRIFEMLTDFVMNAPTITTAKAHAKENPNTYVYQFATSPPTRKSPSHMAYHGEEISFVFALDSNMTDITPGQLNVSKAVMTMWTNFAKSGNPNSPTNVRPVFDLEWMEYGTSQRYLEITPEMTQASVKTRLVARAVELWNVLLPELQHLSTA